ncbi:putative amino acid transporter, transmembrane domain-containing protein [Helianthus annuus]|nr:putative amino acid transporter, transmembrane domain-containing protein [Helianthus annuus]KAJ0774458.1 putative amino acid transporter, transmembrane domain-containing protein [Helianthus annuus]
MAVEQGSIIDDHDKTIRTGTVWTTVAHIITAVIGSGVLSLAWSTAQLGWIGGPLALFGFAVVTYVSACLLSDCYRSPDPVTGTRNRSYTDAVRVILGEKQAWICGLLQYVSFYGAAVAYVKANCYHKEGHDGDCEYGGNFHMLVFGVVQIFMSQIPDLHSMVFVSVVSATMSFSYSSIGLGLGFAQVIENGKIAGSVTGVPAVSVANKLWLTFQALGDIAFAYPFSLILLEIQDTVKSPPAENSSTKRASAIAMVLTAIFYLGCGCFGYAAFGNDTPGNLLTGFGFYEPYWLIAFANACILIYLLGGYQLYVLLDLKSISFICKYINNDQHNSFGFKQLYSQPVFASVERWLTQKFPDTEFLERFHELKLPLLPVFRFNMFRICFRTAYVATTTAIAMLFPFFNEILGVLGALNLWPLSIYFPVEMYIVQRKVKPWSRKWVVLEIFHGVLMVVSVVAFVGSVAGLIQAKMK